ncbi:MULTISPECIES: hypothetical protein [unclassified Moorena]|nr:MULTISPECIES: hypothetical protein [unclassified Moorena]NEP35999.1 hypothetical protein [Moorena sp. SIO3B2]NEQ17913.1 hypothetical protein [Moorena sp. SIO3E2]NEQ08256.1 hypothetical protein [Moorena sp. SIO4E2]NER91590.1 hypothetical protein [Moorena sp. SIO3A2]NET64351.1 hypothetical protein [Moorena sp. SIO1G6]
MQQRRVKDEDPYQTLVIKQWPFGHATRTRYPWKAQPLPKGGNPKG